MQTGGKLQLSFKLSGRYLHVEIIDNGVGYLQSVQNKSKTKKHKSLGIQTINERLKIYNDLGIQESVEILDLKEVGKKGTKVTVLLKLMK
jgi:sensor histidine kinase YesM